MIVREARERPSARTILEHPTWWDGAKRLAFLVEASDRIEIEAQSDTNGPLVVAIERLAGAVIGDGGGGGEGVVRGWSSSFTEALLGDLKRFRKYDTASARDLLRVLRNKRNHYHDLAPELQADFGALPDRFLDYFVGRFPNLLAAVWTVIRDGCRGETQFAAYFDEKWAAASTDGGGSSNSAGPSSGGSSAKANEGGGGWVVSGKGKKNKKGSKGRGKAGKKRGGGKGGNRGRGR